MKNNVTILFLGIALVVSLMANYFLLEQAIEGSYALEFQPRLINDTKVLSASISRDISSEELIRQLRDRDSSIQIEQLENRKSQWNWSGPNYPIAIRVSKNLTYFFNSEDKLERIDHWIAENSPLYERSR
ncbi:MAG: hypothetical protein GY744_04040 [Gammaproteobacteria bacterium]|nr:hypothetical protein [Gammaproteobacteria bacterium]